jgi:hypothetical protein
MIQKGGKVKQIMDIGDDRVLILVNLNSDVTEAEIKNLI